VAEIAAASNEQAQGVMQITKGLGHVDQVTQQNTSLAEESASAAQELTGQAQVLQKLVATFQVDKMVMIDRFESQSVQGAKQRMLQAGMKENKTAGKVQPGAPWGRPTSGV